MNDVIQIYHNLRKTSSQHGDEIAALLGIDVHENPAGFFGMAHNTITLTLELLNYYNELWGKLTSADAEVAERAKDENAQRVLKIQQMAFIDMMSSFEFVAKNTVQVQNQRFGPFNGRIYLSSVMQRSNEIRILADDDYILWTGAIRLRNCLVHNNCIAEETNTYVYPEITLSVHDGAMTQGNLRMFAYLSKWLLDSTVRWTGNACMP